MTASALSQQILAFLWDLILEGAQNGVIAYELIQTSLSILCEFLRGRFRRAKIEFIDKCVDCISKNVAVNEAIELLQSIMDGSFPITSNKSVIANKYELVGYLENEYFLS